MTITTASSEQRAASRRGITLVELLIAIAISSMIMAGVMSSFLFLSRGTIATSDYADMDGEARTALEQFSQEVRMAGDLSNFSSEHVTLSVQDGATTYSVNYTYVPVDRTFYRAYGTPAQKALIKGIDSFTLRRFTMLQTPATNNLETKQLQLDLRASRSGPARAFASNNVISARCVMRNKIVSN